MQSSHVLNGLLFTGILIKKMCIYLSPLSCVLHVPLWFHHRNNSRRRAQIFRLLVMQFTIPPLPFTSLLFETRTCDSDGGGFPNPFVKGMGGGWPQSLAPCQNTESQPVTTKRSMSGGGGDGVCQCCQIVPPCNQRRIIQFRSCQFSETPTAFGKVL
jgi:hypothetical protein